MKYINIDKDLSIQFNEDTKESKTVVISEIKSTIEDAKLRLKSIPKPLSDKELLEWARENYPQVDYSAEIEFLNKTLADNQELLDSIKSKKSFKLEMSTADSLEVMEETDGKIN